MSDGTTKPIEQVKVGGLVLSKNEQTGEIAAKKVTNVSVRADIWTRRLTFDNGAVLETTDEHPLYADGRGFVKAKEVGIGSSIVTRAGPGAKVVAVQADVRQATVYNFTVDTFHTYFVGDLALWAHNIDCETAALTQLQHGEAISGSHSLDRHGADTTLAQQYERAVNGTLPDGATGRPTDATRFLSQVDHLATVTEAERLIQQGNIINGTIDIPMGFNIGEGFRRGGGSVSFVEGIQVARGYVRNGQLTTLFPLAGSVPFVP